MLQTGQATRSTAASAVVVLLLVGVVERAHGAANAPWVKRDICQFGGDPGMWHSGMPVVTQTSNDVSGFNTGPAGLIYRDGKQIPYDVDYATANYGDRWRPFEPECKEEMENLIGPVLNFENPTPPEKAMKVLFLTDSLDRNVIQYMGEHHWRMFGNESEEIRQLNYSRLIQYWHGHGLNYAISNSGLIIFHSFVLGLDPTLEPESEIHDYVKRINYARVKINKLMVEYTGKQQIWEPDLVVVGCNFWTLDTGHLHGVLNNKTGFLLSEDYVQSYMRNLTDMIVRAQQKFPRSFFMYRTVPMARHNCTTGEHDSQDKRDWVRKAWIDQLNQASRYVARKLNLPLLDLEMVTNSLTAIQSLKDDIHINMGVGFEGLNIYMNQLKVWQREKAKRDAEALLQTQSGGAQLDDEDEGIPSARTVQRQQRVIRQSRRAIHQTGAQEKRRSS